MGSKLIAEGPSDKQKKQLFSLFFKTTIYSNNIFKNHQMKNIQMNDLHGPRADLENDVTQ